MVSLLLDTNVVSEAALPAPNPLVVARLEAAEGEAAISAVTAHELRYGLERMTAGRRRDALRRFLRVILERFPVLPYDRRAAAWHATERARLDRLGFVRGHVDGQIAAVAAANDLTLVTRNVRDFDGYRGIRVEDWWSSPP